MATGDGTFHSKIKLAILHTVCTIFLIVLDQRIWCKRKLFPLFDGFFFYPSSPFWFEISGSRNKFVFGDFWEKKD